MMLKRAFYNLLAWSLQNRLWVAVIRRIKDSVSREKPEPAVAMSPDLRPRPISIWQPEVQQGKLVFVRPAQQIFGDHYSNRTAFDQEKAAGVLRICYFGESAALGYLYAPHFHPAAYLESTLNASYAAQNFEVIDLSMTNETLDSMVEKIEAAMQLMPDICVIFAGNNWALLETQNLSPNALDAASRFEVGQILKQGGYDALRDHVVKQRLEKIGRAFDDIDSITQANQAHVILVIPEANLTDWESRQPVPFLPDDGVNQWYQHYEQCQGYLQQKAWPSLLDTAFQMWDLDQGTCPTTYRLIAIAHQNLGDISKARAACQAEIDSIILPNVVYLNAPQITSYDQAVLRRLAGFYGFALVDLPEVFAEHTPGGLPGRDLFFDYCHYTKTGIGIAVSEIAHKVQAILSIEGGQGSGVASEPEIRAEHQALAAFGAAIHTAHRLVAVSEKTEILSYWCQQAYAASPEIAAVMLDFVEARLALLPAVLTQAQQRIVQSEYRLLHSHGWKWDFLDIEIILAIQQTLKADFPELEAQITAALLERHAVERNTYDFADSPKYLWNPLTQSYYDLLKPDEFSQRAVLRSFWPQMDFVLISDATGDLSITLAARHLYARPGAEILLRVNGHAVGADLLGKSFKRLVFTIRREQLNAGVNKLTLQWPALAGDADGLNNAIRRFEMGQMADLAPVFGEIFSLKVER